MTNNTQRLLAEALDLPQMEGAELASRLLESLEGVTDTEADATWTAELERRCAALDSGEAQASDWDEVRRRIEGVIFGR